MAASFSLNIFVSFLTKLKKITLYTKSDFSTNKLTEKGIPVKQGFEYNSGNNSEWLTSEEFLEMLKKG